jgi:DNA processing protein
MTDLEALVALNMVADVGSIRLKKLLEFFGKPQNIFEASFKQLTHIFGIGEKIASQIHTFKKEELDKEFALAKKLGLRIMSWEDEDYPLNLKNIYDPPIVLYLKGELKKEDNLSIAIVGSRRASIYGLSCAGKFAVELAQRGFTIVSGMARGVDSYAHRGALKGNGRTIAVMGSGFNHIYPPENLELAEGISQNGAVISEFAINTEPFKQNFPRRNRVISGLTLGVLIVEAARNSGALITADFALEQGRDVFALPGKVDSQNSFGTNALIKDGAKLVSSVDDILEEFNIFDPIVKLKPDSTQSEKVLDNLFSDEPISLDEIVERTNMQVGEVSVLLLKLQLKKLIKQLPGKQFVRSVDEEEKLSYR